MLSTNFALDARLAADTVAIGGLGLSAVRLMNDARFPWLILVPRRPDLAEFTDLPPVFRGVLMEEIAQASLVLRETVPCYKINVAAFGNMVRQLHIHVIARVENDPAWPGSVFGHGAAVPYEATARDALVVKLKSGFGFA